MHPARLSIAVLTVMSSVIDSVYLVGGRHAAAHRVGRGASRSPGTELAPVGAIDMECLLASDAELK